MSGSQESTEITSLSLMIAAMTNYGDVKYNLGGKDYLYGQQYYEYNNIDVPIPEALDCSGFVGSLYSRMLGDNEFS